MRVCTDCETMTHCETHHKPEGTYPDPECSKRMREYAEHVCAPRVTDATEVPLTPFAMLLAEAVR